MAQSRSNKTKSAASKSAAADLPPVQKVEILPGSGVYAEYQHRPEVASQRASDGERINLRAALSRKPIFKHFHEWIIGSTPLICHAWSHKAKMEMLQKQVKATRGGKEARDPDYDFVNSLYEMGKDKGGKAIFGFPVTGIKDSFLSAAHKDRGVPRSTARAALWLDAEMVRVRPALSQAICDMPLVRIWGDQPVMREDMVRIGAGLNKTANLAYRPQFTIWAIRIKGRINVEQLPEEALGVLIEQAGMMTGIGEWRNDKSGVFGSYHLGSTDEWEAWEAFSRGEGPMPIPEQYRLAEAAE